LRRWAFGFHKSSWFGEYSILDEAHLRRKKKLLAVLIVSLILICSSILLWQMQSVEAELLDFHPGLVGWWRFDEGSGRTAVDSSGNGNDGTIYGASWVEGKHGNALSFDGVDDLVEFGSRSSLHLGTGDFSCSLWVKQDSRAAFPFDFIYSRGLSAHWYIRALSQTAIQVGLNDGTNRQFIDYAVNLWNKWVFIAVVRDGRLLHVYLNGIAQTDLDLAYVGAIDDETSILRLAYNDLTGKHGKCLLDDVRIYNRILTAKEIKENYQETPDFSSTILA